MCFPMWQSMLGMTEKNPVWYSDVNKESKELSLTIRQIHAIFQSQSKPSLTTKLKGSEWATLTEIQQRASKD